MTDTEQVEPSSFLESLSDWLEEIPRRRFADMGLVAAAFFISAGILAQSATAPGDMLGIGIATALLICGLASFIRGRLVCCKGDEIRGAFYLLSVVFAAVASVFVLGSVAAPARAHHVTVLYHRDADGELQWARLYNRFAFEEPSGFFFKRASVSVASVEAAYPVTRESLQVVCSDETLQMLTVTFRGYTSSDLLLAQFKEGKKALSGLEVRERLYALLQTGAIRYAPEELAALEQQVASELAAAFPDIVIEQLTLSAQS